MTSPSESTELERINGILWPHPFSGEYAKPNQVAISNGLPPEGKAFVMPYSVVVKAIQHLLAQEYSRGQHQAWEEAYQLGIADALASLPEEMPNLLGPREQTIFANGNNFATQQARAAILKKKEESK